MTAGQLALLAVLVWLPGAVLFRIPCLDRTRRAGLPAEERWFWQTVSGTVLALSVVLALGVAGRYRFEYLVGAQLLASAIPVLTWRGALRLGITAPRPRITAAVALALIVLCWLRFLPPAEYVIGGKDPGAYVNEGVQLAQRGSIVVTDPVVAAVPPGFRDLFFPSHGQPEYYGLRFMGFFIQDPDTGHVVGQFPHLLPSALAIGYGIDGLTGVRRTTPVLATLGVLAVYFAGAALFGRAVGAAAAGLLALNVVQVWFARYPNTEVLMQLLLFAAVLAALRWQVDGDPFFAPMAGALAGLMVFLRFDAVLAVGAVAAGVGLGVVAGYRVTWTFVGALLVPLLLAAAYLTGPMRAYAAYPLAFIRNMPGWQHVVLVLAAACATGVVASAFRQERVRQLVTRWFPTFLALAVVAAAMYALALRQPAGRLAAHDAFALRMYAAFYVTTPAVLAALLGFAVYARAAFWRSPVFFLLVAVFGLFFFYKIRIVPEHFWAARRFVPVILPATLLLASAAAIGGRGVGPWPLRAGRMAIGVIFLSLLGGHYARASAPVTRHVEYAGSIAKVEALARQIGDRDLVLAESRDAGGDTHVVALPLAYIYARNVLVLDSARPDVATFPAFLAWARTRYERVLFLGGGGTDLTSSGAGARRVWGDRFAVPEYESVRNGYPRGAQERKFDYSIYELTDAGVDGTRRLDLDIGGDDDLHVVRFGAKETSDGHSFRWTGALSVIALGELPPSAAEVTLTMGDGGRPPAAPPARVEVWLNDRLLGTVEVDGPFRPYVVPISGAAPQRPAGTGPAQLRLRSVLWNPRQVLGAADDRDLGVMVDRVTIR